MTTPTCKFVHGDVQTLTRTTSAAAAITAGEIFTEGTLTLVAHANFAVGDVVELAYDGGVYDVAKDPDVDFTIGDRVHVDFVTGLAVTAPTADSKSFGICAQTTPDNATSVRCTHAQAVGYSTTNAGSMTATDITGSDASLAIQGLAAAQGGAVPITGGTSATAGNAGGAVSLTGGTPGATGVGGTATVAGGPGGATSGAGGAVTVAGGAGTNGNGNGGAVSVLGGNAHGSGTDGVLNLGTSNTSAITIGATGIVTRNAGYSQVNGNAAVTATTGGGTTGLIPAGASFVTVTSDSAAKQISLPAATVGDHIWIKVGATGCELISSVASHKVNDVVVGATNEAALTADSLYSCRYVAADTWIVVGFTKLGAVEAALVPDPL